MGAHLSARAAVAGSPVAAWMQAPACQPDMVCVRVACAERLMSPHEAYNLGRVLTSLGSAARRVEASPAGPHAGGGMERDEDEVDLLIGRAQRLLADWHRDRRRR
jgi:hypothetical protein